MVPTKISRFLLNPRAVAVKVTKRHVHFGTILHCCGLCGRFSPPLKVVDKRFPHETPQECATGATGKCGAISQLFYEHAIPMSTSGQYFRRLSGAGGAPAGKSIPKLYYGVKLRETYTGIFALDLIKVAIPAFSPPNGKSIRQATSDFLWVVAHL